MKGFNDGLEEEVLICWRLL